MKCTEWRYTHIMAHDYCCINYCNNDKRNDSGKNLSFFNFPLNPSQRSQWIAALKRYEGPLSEVSVSIRDQPAVRRTCYLWTTFHFDLRLSYHTLYSRNIYSIYIQSNYSQLFESTSLLTLDFLLLLAQGVKRT